MFAEVAFPLPVRKEFTYYIPEKLNGQVQPGVQVLAPLGKKTASGWVTRLVREVEFQTKPLSQVNSAGILLSPLLLELTRWLSNYYFCSWGEAIRAALPAQLNLKPRVKFRLRENVPEESNNLTPPEIDLLKYLTEKPQATLPTLARRFFGPKTLNVLRQLEEKGTLDLVYEFGDAERKHKREQIVRLADSKIPEQLTETESQIMELLKSDPVIPLAELKKIIPRPQKPLALLEKRGLVRIETGELYQDRWQSYVVPQPARWELTSEQKKCLEHILPHVMERHFHPLLLQGVTGSGKTEIYIQLCQKVLQQERSVLILIPEISMAIQTVLAFRATFGDLVTELHSGLTPQEKVSAWSRIKSKKHTIVIGARSAIFAPLENVGLIVVDEEQDGSYKQSDPAPRYHARDLALVRGKLEKAVVLLGSATPALESYHNAVNGKYTLLALNHRILNRPLAKVDLVDMKSQTKQNNYSPLSDALIQKLSASLQDKRQVILFLNRRGFSNLIKCQDCGYVPVCRNCNITLTYHVQGHWLRCHFCGYQKKAPETCPACHSMKFNYRGFGTQRIESEIKRLFGENSVRRLDSDLSAKRNYARNLFLDFKAKKFPVLLGTQMVAKGYDFPEVTLVGVISGDIALDMPDFRAAERTFQLLTQVAGRSGRGEKPGEVLIQTYHPGEAAITLARTQDYPDFYRQEISIRRQLHYPPFCHLIMLTITGTDQNQALDKSEKLKQRLRELNHENTYIILGPAPAPIPKINRRYRHRLLLKTSRVYESLDQIGKALSWLNPASSQARVSVDVDPVDML
ncbi:MAG: primosomal protein N' [candidate division Zixibacteria bacterium]|nr:primosomal protein N' [candidate division Zixibacteria bacterium]